MSNVSKAAGVPESEQKGTCEFSLPPAATVSFQMGYGNAS